MVPVFGIGREKASCGPETFFRKRQHDALDSKFDMIYVNDGNNLMSGPLDPEKESVEPRYRDRLSWKMSSSGSRPT